MMHKHSHYSELPVLIGIVMAGVLFTLLGCGVQHVVAGLRLAGLH